MAKEETEKEETEKEETEKLNQKIDALHGSFEKMKVERNEKVSYPE
jgi:hypothetical protein